MSQNHLLCYSTHYALNFLFNELLSIISYPLLPSRLAKDNKAYYNTKYACIKGSYMGLVSRYLLANFSMSRSIF